MHNINDQYSTLTQQHCTLNNYSVAQPLIEYNAKWIRMPENEI